MSDKAVKVKRRNIRRAFGNESMDIVDALIRQSGSHERLLSRGLFGRLKLLFGY